MFSLETARCPRQTAASCSRLHDSVMEHRRDIDTVLQNRKLECSISYDVSPGSNNPNAWFNGLYWSKGPRDGSLLQLPYPTNKLQFPSKRWNALAVAQVYCPQTHLAAICCSSQYAYPQNNHSGEAPTLFRTVSATVRQSAVIS